MPSLPHFSKKLLHPSRCSGQTTGVVFSSALPPHPVPKPSAKPIVLPSRYFQNLKPPHLHAGYLTESPSSCPASSVLAPCQPNFSTEGRLILSKGNLDRVTSLLTSLIWILISLRAKPNIHVPFNLSASPLPPSPTLLQSHLPTLALGRWGPGSVCSLCLEHSPVVTAKAQPLISSLP